MNLLLPIFKRRTPQSNWQSKKNPPFCLWCCNTTSTAWTVSLCIRIEETTCLCHHHSCQECYWLSTEWKDIYWLKLSDNSSKQGKYQTCNLQSVIKTQKTPWPFKTCNFWIWWSISWGWKIERCSSSFTHWQKCKTGGTAHKKNSICSPSESCVGRDIML
jgi:hypothetical protein